MTVEAEYFRKHATVLVLRKTNHKLPNPSQEIRMEKRSSDLWAIFYYGVMINRVGNSEWDYLPSSRDEDHLSLSRFTIEEAKEIGDLWLLGSPSFLDEWTEMVKESVLKVTGGKRLVLPKTEDTV